MSISLDKDFNIDEISFEKLNGFKELLSYIENTEIPSETSTSKRPIFL